MARIQREVDDGRAEGIAHSQDNESTQERGQKCDDVLDVLEIFGFGAHDDRIETSRRHKMYNAMKDQSKRKRVIAHRGASGEAPENTTAAFDLAFEQGADGIELDVRLSRDGQPVVIHDSELTRVAGVPVRVAESDWDDLRRIPLLNQHDAMYDGQKLSLLGEILERYGHSGELHIELKCEGVSQAVRVASVVAGLLKERVPELKIESERIWISSFHHLALCVMRVKAGSFPRALIVTNRAPQRFFRVPRFVWAIAPVGIDAAWEAIVMPDAEGWLARAGQVAGWPMDDPTVSGHERFERVDRIITNRPRLWVP